MKKLLSIALLAASVSTGVMASDMSGLQLGYSSTAIDKETSNGGGYFGLDYMPGSTSGFGLGLGLDANVFGTSANGFGNGTSAYTLGATAKVGYSFQDKFNVPLHLKAGVGYGVFDVGQYDSWGLQYETSADYTIYKGFGAGVKYKVAKADALGQNFDVSSTIFYLNITK